MSANGSPSVSAPAEPPVGLDLSALAGYLDRDVPGLRTGPLRGRLIAGGRSNLTYQVTDGLHEWVVRRPPLGHVLETAHDMTREYRVMSALAGTPVPVPRMVTLCPTEAVLDTPFYVMDFVHGTIYRTEKQLKSLSADAAQVLAGALVDAS
jgi:aminoglycoside phosphotransferase (APT) family kinase protein